MKLSILVAILVIAEKITYEEANILQRKLKYRAIPDEWEKVIKEFEKIIDRPLYDFKYIL